MNKTIVLKERPAGTPRPNHFEFMEEEKPPIRQGEILLKATYVSVDPYLRGRMSDAKSYVPPFKLNEPILSGVVAEVTESHHPDFKKGEYVTGNLDWKEFQRSWSMLTHLGGWWFAAPFRFTMKQKSPRARGCSPYW